MCMYITRNESLKEGPSDEAVERRTIAIDCFLQGLLHRAGGTGEGFGPLCVDRAIDSQLFHPSRLKAKSAVKRNLQARLAEKPINIAHQHSMLGGVPQRDADSQDNQQRRGTCERKLLLSVCLDQGMHLCVTSMHTVQMQH